MFPLSLKASYLSILQFRVYDLEQRKDSLTKQILPKIIPANKVTGGKKKLALGSVVFKW